MSIEDNKALIRRFYNEVTNGGNVAVLDELLAPNFEGFKVEGEDHGVAPTGKQVKITGIDIFRVVDGKIVEQWVELDMQGVMHQLGHPSHSG